MSVNGKDQLIKPVVNDGTVLYYMTYGELFDTLHSAQIGHCVRYRTGAKLKIKYCNIIYETNNNDVMLKHLCVRCQQALLEGAMGHVTDPGPRRPG